MGHLALSRKLAMSCKPRDFAVLLAFCAGRETDGDWTRTTRVQCRLHACSKTVHRALTFQEKDA
jgi:hypothetical protein